MLGKLRYGKYYKNEQEIGKGSSQNETKNIGKEKMSTVQNDKLKKTTTSNEYENLKAEITKHQSHIEKFLKGFDTTKGKNENLRLLKKNINALKDLIAQIPKEAKLQVQQEALSEQITALQNLKTRLGSNKKLEDLSKTLNHELAAVNKLNKSLQETLSKTNKNTTKNSENKVIESKENNSVPSTEADKLQQREAFDLYDAYKLVRAKGKETTPGEFLQARKVDKTQPLQISPEGEKAFLALAAGKDGHDIDPQVAHTLSLESTLDEKTGKLLSAKDMLIGKVLSLKKNKDLTSYLQESKSLDGAQLTQLATQLNLLNETTAQKAQVTLRPRTTPGYEAYYTLSIRIPKSQDPQTGVVRYEKPIQLFVDKEGNPRKVEEMAEYKETIMGGVMSLFENTVNGGKRFEFKEDNFSEEDKKNPLNAQSKEHHDKIEGARVSTTKEAIGKIINTPSYFRLLLEHKLHEGQQQIKDGKNTDPLYLSIKELTEKLKKNQNLFKTLEDLHITTKNRQTNEFELSFMLDKKKYTISLSQKDFLKLPLSAAEREPLQHDSLIDTTDYQKIGSYMDTLLKGQVWKLDKRKAIFSPFSQELRKEGDKQVKSLLIYLDPTQGDLKGAQSFLETTFFSTDANNKRQLNKDTFTQFKGNLPPTLANGIMGLEFKAYPGFANSKGPDGRWTKERTHVIQVDLIDSIMEPKAQEQMLDKTGIDINSDAGILKAMMHSNGMLSVLGSFFKAYGKNEVVSGNLSIAPGRLGAFSREQQSLSVLGNNYRKLFRMHDGMTPEMITKQLGEMTSLLTAGDKKKISNESARWEVTLQSFFYRYANYHDLNLEKELPRIATITQTLETLSKPQQTTDKKTPAQDKTQLLLRGMSERGSEFLRAIQLSQKAMLSERLKLDHKGADHKLNTNEAIKTLNFLVTQSNKQEEKAVPFSKEALLSNDEKKDFIILGKQLLNNLAATFPDKTKLAGVFSKGDIKDTSDRFARWEEIKSVLGEPDPTWKSTPKERLTLPNSSSSLIPTRNPKNATIEKFTFTKENETLDSKSESILNIAQTVQTLPDSYFTRFAKETGQSIQSLRELALQSILNTYIRATSETKENEQQTMLNTINTTDLRKAKPDDMIKHYLHLRTLTTTVKGVVTPLYDKDTAQELVRLAHTTAEGKNGQSLFQLKLVNGVPTWETTADTTEKKVLLLKAYSRVLAFKDLHKKTEGVRPQDDFGVPLVWKSELTSKIITTAADKLFTGDGKTMKELYSSIKNNISKQDNEGQVAWKVFEQRYNKEISKKITTKPQEKK